MLNTNSLILMFLFSCLLYYLINNHHLHIKLTCLADLQSTGTQNEDFLKLFLHH